MGEYEIKLERMRERWICTVEREKLWQLFSDGGKHSAPVCSVLSPHQRYFILCECNGCMPVRAVCKPHSVAFGVPC